MDPIVTPDPASGRPSPPSTEDVRRLAVAIAAVRKKARLIEPDNSTVEFAELHDAVESGRSFLVTVQDDIVAFDFDDPDGNPLIAEVAGEIRAAGSLPVIWNSGRPGHQHILGRVGAEARVRIEVLVAERVGTQRIARRAIRPPLSPHREGWPVSLVEPDTVNEAALRLRDPELNSPVRMDPSRLSRKMGLLLRTGDKPTGDTSPSGVMQSLLIAMVNARWTRHHAFNVLAKSENKGGTALQQRLADEGDRAADRWFEHCWLRAEAYVRDNPVWRGRPEVVEALADAKATTDLAEWPGADGQRAKAVLSAVLDVALSRGSIEVQVSVRQLAEGAGLSKDSVMKKYLPALQNMRLLTKTKDHQGSGGTTYRLNLKAIRSLPLSIHPAGREFFGGHLSANHDAFRQGGGLGKSGHAILEALTQSGTPSEVVERTNIPAPSVRRLLRALEIGGLVSETAGVWTRLEPLGSLQVALVGYAYDAGVSAVGARQKEFHANERAIRDAARSRQSPPETTISLKHGYEAVRGKRYWPLGRPVNIEELPPEGGVGRILVSLIEASGDSQRRHLLVLGNLVEVRQVPSVTLGA